MIQQSLLEDLYTLQSLSMKEIATRLDCSVNKVVYWMDRYAIKRRSIAEAIYIRHNPNGDPFSVKEIISSEDALLMGLGLGLYWGEGTKSNKNSVRLGNTDPDLILCFIKFLVELCGVKKADLRFGLQIFTDISEEEALLFWLEKLGVNRTQLYKVTQTISGSIGTYRQKSLYGVVTVYYNNTKLRNKLISLLPR